MSNGRAYAALNTLKGLIVSVYDTLTSTSNPKVTSGTIRTNVTMQLISVAALNYIFARLFDQFV